MKQIIDFFGNSTALGELRFCFANRVFPYIFHCCTPKALGTSSLLADFKRSPIKRVILVLCVLCLYSSCSYGFDQLSPDYVMMKDGTRYEGLIIKNDAKTIILQQPLGERTISKASVERINNAHKSMVYFADLMDPDKAPPWRMMVQDLRCDDRIKSFVQIPATRITQGYLRNVPYLSFHINAHGEMNIYGNPDDPACVELGIYCRGEQLRQFQELARNFLAGYISSRAALAIFYSLNLKQDEKRSGKFIFKIMPPSEPDSFGGWWISIYDPKRLQQARISDAKYQKITLPSHEIRKKDGTLQKSMNLPDHAFLTKSMMAWFGKLPGFYGFYRNGDNELNVIPFTSSSMEERKYHH